jgi:hypothetical protein
MAAFLVPLLVLAIVALLLWLKLRQVRRAEFIRRQPFPKGLYAALRKTQPQLSERDCALVGQALRQFFLAWLHSGFKPISMPSKAADELWHAFILDTRAYQAWCDSAFGRFFHHSPAATLSPGTPRLNEGLRRCWWQCCRADNIDPRAPARLPLLFAIDTKLHIVGGFHYNLPRVQTGSGDGGGGDSGVTVECFADSRIDGTTDGLGDGSGDGGGDGGGCGGGE